MRKIFYEQDGTCNLNGALILPSISVIDSYNMSKKITAKVGEVRQENEEGEPLFIKKLFKTITEKILSHYEETLDSEDSEGNPYPKIMVSVQKVDSDNQPLYTEEILGEDGQAQDYFETTKKVDELGRPNKPIMIEVQKTSVKGKPLFSKPVYIEKEKEVQIGEELVTEDTGVPAMKELLGEVDITLLDKPEKFNIQEVITDYTIRLGEKLKGEMVIEEFIDTSGLDTEGNYNLGLGIISINPNGSVTLKPKGLNLVAKYVKLVSPVPEGVEVLVNGQVVKEKALLSAPSQAITIKITNTTSNRIVAIDRLLLLFSDKILDKDIQSSVELISMKAQLDYMQQALDDLVMGGEM